MHSGITLKNSSEILNISPVCVVNIRCTDNIIVLCLRKENESYHFWKWLDIFKSENIEFQLERP